MLTVRLRQPWRYRRRDVLRLAPAAGSALAIGSAWRSPAIATEELVVTMYGGPMEQGWRRNVIDPFAKQFGASVIVATGLSLDNLAKMRAQRADPQLDVVAMDTVAAQFAADRGGAGQAEYPDDARPRVDGDDGAQPAGALLVDRSDLA